MIYEDKGTTCRGNVYYDNNRLYFDDAEDDLLNESEEVYMVDTRGSLNQK